MKNETMHTVIASLSEREKTLGELVRTGLTPAIRKAAEEDYKKTMTAWAEVEKISYDMSTPEVVVKEKIVNHIHVGNFENMRLADVEKLMIINALKVKKGRRNAASEMLGISERTIFRKIKEYGIKEDEWLTR